MDDEVEISTRVFKQELTEDTASAYISALTRSGRLPPELRNVATLLAKMQRSGAHGIDAAVPDGVLARVLLGIPLVIDMRALRPRGEPINPLPARAVRPGQRRHFFLHGSRALCGLVSEGDELTTNAASFGREPGDCAQCVAALRVSYPTTPT